MSTTRPGTCKQVRMLRPPVSAVRASKDVLEMLVGMRPPVGAVLFPVSLIGRDLAECPADTCAACQSSWLQEVEDNPKHAVVELQQGGLALRHYNACTRAFGFVCHRCHAHIWNRPEAADMSSAIARYIYKEGLPECGRLACKLERMPTCMRAGRGLGCAVRQRPLMHGFDGFHCSAPAAQLQCLARAVPQAVTLAALPIITICSFAAQRSLRIRPARRSC